MFTAKLQLIYILLSREVCCFTALMREKEKRKMTDDQRKFKNKNNKFKKNQKEGKTKVQNFQKD